MPLARRLPHRPRKTSSAVSTYSAFHYLESSANVERIPGNVASKCKHFLLCVDDAGITRVNRKHVTGFMPHNNTKFGTIRIVFTMESRWKMIREGGWKDGTGRRLYCAWVKS